MPPDHREVEYNEATRAFHSTEPEFKQVGEKTRPLKKCHLRFHLCNSDNN